MAAGIVTAIRLHNSKELLDFPELYITYIIVIINA